MKRTRALGKLVIASLVIIAVIAGSATPVNGGPIQN